MIIKCLLNSFIHSGDLNDLCCVEVLCLLGIKLTVVITFSFRPRAFLTLQEAIRCDYENWKIWENYLLV